jgi:hypothetical protein
MSEQAPLVVDLVPELAEELERELRASGDSALADQVASLRMEKLCPCGDDFCATFATALVPEGSAKKKRYGVPLAHHSLIVQVVDREIVEVEVLFRDELRPKIRAVFADETERRIDQKRADQN